jgi:hypothetical protein
MVMISTKNWHMNTPSRKLSDQWAGPYRVVKQIGNAYQVDLLDRVHVHPIFAPEKLRKALSSKPLQDQIQDEPPAVEVDGQEEWEVEHILASRISRRKLQYRVK